MLEPNTVGEVHRWMKVSGMQKLYGAACADRGSACIADAALSM